MVGVWPKNADKADVNTAHLNNSGTALATGDDFGCLKLFDHFPITEKFVSFQVPKFYPSQLYSAAIDDIVGMASSGYLVVHAGKNNPH